ncbi:UTRA domain-containing protein [Streptomyces longwoodensis]
MAQALDLKPGSNGLRRSRVYRDRHGIAAHSTSWILAKYAELIPQLTRSERLAGGTALQLIAQTTGHPITHQFGTASARLLTPEDELNLEKALREPMVVMTARFVDSAGTVVEYGVDLCGPGRTWQMESEVTP